MRYFPLGKPCNRCGYLSWEGEASFLHNQLSVKAYSATCTYGDGEFRVLDIEELTQGNIPDWCPLIVHVLLATNEQN